MVDRDKLLVAVLMVDPRLLVAADLTVDPVEGRVCHRAVLGSTSGKLVVGSIDMRVSMLCKQVGRYGDEVRGVSSRTSLLVDAQVLVMVATSRANEGRRARRSLTHQFWPGNNVSNVRMVFIRMRSEVKLATSLKSSKQCSSGGESRSVGPCDSCTKMND